MVKCLAEWKTALALYFNKTKKDLPKGETREMKNSYSIHKNQKQSYPFKNEMILIDGCVELIHIIKSNPFEAHYFPKDAELYGRT